MIARHRPLHEVPPQIGPPVLTRRIWPRSDAMGHRGSPKFPFRDDSDGAAYDVGRDGVLALLVDIRIRLLIAASDMNGARMLRCRTRRSTSRMGPPHLSACPGACRRQSLGRDRCRAAPLRRRRGGPARGFRRDHRPRRARQGPEGPLRRGAPRRVGQHDVQPRRRRTASTVAGPASSSSTSSAARTARWSTTRASRQVGAATSASATSATGQHQGSRRSSVVESLDELRERIPPQLFDMVAGSARQPAVEDLDI